LLCLSKIFISMHYYGLILMLGCLEVI
jgi:hypothetical protein